MKRNLRSLSWLALMAEFSGRPLVTLLRRDLLLAAECCESLRGSQPESLAVNLTQQCRDIYWPEGLIDVGLDWHGGGWARQAVVGAVLDPDEDLHIEQMLRGHRPDRRRELEPSMREHHRLVSRARASGAMDDALAVARHVSGETGGVRIHCYRLEPAGWEEALEALSRLRQDGVTIAPVWDLPATRRPRRFGTSLQDLLRNDEMEQKNLARIKALAAKHAAAQRGLRERR